MTGAVRLGPEPLGDLEGSDTYTGPTTVVITSLNDGTAQLIG